MQLYRTYASLLAAHLLVLAIICYAAWQHFDKSARLPLLSVVVINQLLLSLKGYDFWRKRQNTFAWGLTVLMPLVGLATIYFTLQTNR